MTFGLNILSLVLSLICFAFADMSGRSRIVTDLSSTWPVAQQNLWRTSNATSRTRGFCVHFIVYFAEVLVSWDFINGKKYEV